MEADVIAARNALRNSDARFTALADALPQMVWSSLPDGHFDYFNALWYDFTGVELHSTDGSGWLALIHDDDRERVAATWRQSLVTGEPYEIEYRLRERGDGFRWMLGRAQPVRNGEGKIVRWIGTWTDIHETRAYANEVEILSRELSHRIKNIFAVVSSLIAMSARQAPEHKEFAGRMRQRIAALGRAHEYVRPHSEESRQPGLAVTLHGLLAQILAPYPAFDTGQIAIRGDDVEVDDRSATPLALLIHELATNATKYGALGDNGGHVALRTAFEDSDLIIEWHETGGPRVTAEPGHTGFGTLLTNLSIRDQLGGTVAREWREGGLRLIAKVPRQSLMRRAA
jgi:PAS domain S-box-containing protein